MLSEHAAKTFVTLRHLSRAASPTGAKHLDAALRVMLHIPSVIHSKPPHHIPDWVWKCQLVSQDALGVAEPQSSCGSMKVLQEVPLPRPSWSRPQRGGLADFMQQSAASTPERQIPDVLLLDQDARRALWEHPICTELRLLECSSSFRPVHLGLAHWGGAVVGCPF